MFRVIVGKKITQARGERSQAQIVEAANNVFSKQQLSAWEKDEYRPTDDNLFALLTALDVNYEDITEEYEKAIAHKSQK